MVSRLTLPGMPHRAASLPDDDKSVSTPVKSWSAWRWLTQQEAEALTGNSDSNQAVDEVDEELKDLARLSMGVFARRSYWPAFAPCILNCGEGAPADRAKSADADREKRSWVRLDILPSKKHNEISRTQTFNRNRSPGGSRLSAPRDGGSRLSTPRSGVSTPRSSIGTPRSSIGTPRSSLNTPRSSTPRSSTPRASATPREGVSKDSKGKAEAGVSESPPCLVFIEGEVLETRMHQTGRYEIALRIRPVGGKRPVWVYLRTASVNEYKQLCNRCNGLTRSISVLPTKESPDLDAAFNAPNGEAPRLSDLQRGSTPEPSDPRDCSPAARSPPVAEGSGSLQLSQVRIGDTPPQPEQQ